MCLCIAGCLEGVPQAAHGRAQQGNGRQLEEFEFLTRLHCFVYVYFGEKGVLNVYYISF